MSISFYLLLLLFLICISFQPCPSQCLQLADNKFQKKLQAPIKGRLGKIVLSWDKAAIECMKLSPPAPVEGRELIVRSERAQYKRRRRQLKRLEEMKKVSWKVLGDDHKKVKGNSDVYSSDYEHARTHPPSHN